MHTQENTVADAVDRQAKPEKPEFFPIPRNESELVLRRMMRASGFKDNRHKNLAIVTTTGIIDSHGFTPCGVETRDPVTGERADRAPFISHKRHLHLYVGALPAKRWWHKSLGIRARRH